jgi:hypothetical protein
MRPTLDSLMARTWGWWRLAVECCGRLTTPKTDIAAAHREVDALIRGSWLWSCGQSLATKLQAAWLDSTARVVVRWTASQWR